MGLFYPFLKDSGVRLIGVEAAGHGIASGAHAAPLCAGRPGILHGQRSYLLQDQHGQVANAHSISAGLDYPGVGPEHAWLKDTGRAEYVSATDDEALEAFQRLTREEGSCRLWNHPTPLPTPLSWPPLCLKIRPLWFASQVVETKIFIRWQMRWA